MYVKSLQAEVCIHGLAQYLCIFCIPFRIIKKNITILLLRTGEVNSPLVSPFWSLFVIPFVKKLPPTQS